MAVAAVNSARCFPTRKVNAASDVEQTQRGARMVIMMTKEEK
jgi:hypothetical protein